MQLEQIAEALAPDAAQEQRLMTEVMTYQINPMVNLLLLSFCQFSHSPG